MRLRAELDKGEATLREAVEGDSRETVFPSTSRRAFKRRVPKEEEEKRWKRKHPEGKWTESATWRGKLHTFSLVPQTYMYIHGDKKPVCLDRYTHFFILTRICESGNHRILCSVAQMATALTTETVFAT